MLKFIFFIWRLISSGMPFTVTFFFFFNDTATTEIYTLSLHDALPISLIFADRKVVTRGRTTSDSKRRHCLRRQPFPALLLRRSEEHTSELQSLTNLVCRLLLEKKKKNNITTTCEFLN